MSAAGDGHGQAGSRRCRQQPGIRGSVPGPGSTDPCRRCRALSGITIPYRPLRRRRRRSPGRRFATTHPPARLRPPGLCFLPPAFLSICLSSHPYCSVPGTIYCSVTLNPIVNRDNCSLLRGRNAIINYRHYSADPRHISSRILGCARLSPFQRHRLGRDRIDFRAVRRRPRAFHAFDPQPASQSATPDCLLAAARRRIRTSATGAGKCVCMRQYAWVTGWFVG